MLEANKTHCRPSRCIGLLSAFDQACSNCLFLFFTAMLSASYAMRSSTACWSFGLKVGLATPANVESYFVRAPLLHPFRTIRPDVGDFHSFLLRINLDANSGHSSLLWDIVASPAARSKRDPVIRGELKIAEAFFLPQPLHGCQSRAQRVPDAFAAPEVQKQGDGAATNDGVAAANGN